MFTSEGTATAADAPARAPRRKLIAGIVVAAIALATAIALALFTFVFDTAAKKPAPAVAKAPVTIVPAPGHALSATVGATLTDPDVVMGIAFSPDGKTVAASSENLSQTAGHVDTWNASSGQQTGTLNGPAAGGGLLYGTAFNPKDANTLAVADQNGVDVWNLAARSSRTYAGTDVNGINDVAYSPDGKTIAEAGADGNVYLSDAANGLWLGKEFDDPAVNDSTQLIQVAFSPDGKTLAAADSAGNVYVWGLSGGAPLVIKGKPSTTSLSQMLAFSPEGRTLAVVLHGGVQLWDLGTGKRTATIDYGTAPDAVAFSPSGNALAVGNTDGDLDLWDLTTDQVTLADSTSGGWSQLEFSMDGKTLAALDGGGDIHLYRVGYPAS